jgi:hypothetical protein
MNDCEYRTDVVWEITNGHENKPVPIDNHKADLDNPWLKSLLVIYQKSV